jgi:hypothetical protein
VIVYAGTRGGGNKDNQSQTQGSNPVVETSISPTGAAPTPTPTPSDPLGGGPGPSGSASASPATGTPCIYGVFIEEQHDEQVCSSRTSTTSRSP